jgi:predicted MPP superfamily phosphohydrolase
VKFTTTRALLLAILIAASLLVFATAFVPGDFEVTTHDVGAGSQSRVRVVQISDLHIQQFGERESRLVQTIRDLQPDVIALTGDIIDDPENQQSLASFLGALEPVPRVAVLGNWEYWSGVDIGWLRKIYESSPNSHLLINQTTNIAIKSREFKFVGLDDFTAGKPRTSLIQRPTTAPTTIVLQHSPGLFHRTSGTSKDQICLSGHTHGGQVTFFGRALWTPPGSGDFLAGWYATAECRLYVSRGIGTSILPIRLGAHPEIAVFDF